MSERRTYTLDDRAVDFLNAVPKDRNSKFVSDLIISFFEGESLLSLSDWEFLSSEVQGSSEDSDSDSDLVESSSISDSFPSRTSNPIDSEKARISHVLKSLHSLDINSYFDFHSFLLDPDVRKGGVFDLSLSELYSHYHSKDRLDWDFVSLLPDSAYKSYSSHTLAFFLSEQVSQVKPDFDILEFLENLLKSVSSVLLRDLVSQQTYGMNYSEYLLKKVAEEDAKANEEKAEKERLELLSIERKNAYYISSVEMSLRRKLSTSKCDASSIFSKCEGKLSAGYFIDPDVFHPSSGLYSPQAYYSPVYCEKHRSKYASSFDEYTFVTQE